MINNKLTKLCMIGLLVGTVGLGTTSCNQGGPTGGAAPEEQDVFSSELEDLRNRAEAMSTQMDFPTFRNYTASAFEEVADIVKDLQPVWPTPAYASQLANNIEESADMVDKANNPQRLVNTSKIGFDRTVVALKEVQNKTGVQMPDFQQRISRIENRANQLNTQNYQSQIKQIFMDLSQLMIDMNRAIGEEATR